MILLIALAIIGLFVLALVAAIEIEKIATQILNLATILRELVKLMRRMHERIEALGGKQ